MGNKSKEFVKTYFTDFKVNENADVNKNDIWKKILERRQCVEVEESPRGLLVRFGAYVQSKKISFSVAASISILVATFALYLVNIERDIKWIEVASGDARKKMELPDGTVVGLNKHTILLYADNFKKNRIVKLNGAATFDVPKVKDGVKYKDFRVLCDRSEIIVKGTYFDVWSYSDDHTVTASLYRGKIEMSIEGSAENIVIEPHQRIRLDKNDMSYKLSPVKADDAEWVRGEYNFKGESFGNLMKIISRIYNVEYQFVNQELSEILFTGRFRESNSLRHTMGVLKTLTGVNIEIEDNMVTISSCK